MNLSCLELQSLVGNEIMGNNNVTGQQVSEETADGVDKTVEPSNSSPGPNDTNSETNNEKDGTEDVNWSKSSKKPIITNAKDKKLASYQNISSDKIEGLDEKNMSLSQYNTSTKDDLSSNLQKDDEPLRKEATETAIFSSEITALVTTEDVTSYKNSSISNQRIVQLMHGTRDTSEENIQGNYKSLLHENIEGSLEDQEEASSHDNSPMIGNLAGEDTTENLEQGFIEVPTVEDKLVAMQGETTSSTESIASTYLDADDSEIKEVVIEDEPRQRETRPDVHPLDATNIETSKNDNVQIQIQIPHDKEENRAISKTATVQFMIESDDALDDNNIHGLGNQNEDNTEGTLCCNNLYNGEVLVKCQTYLRNPTAINDLELGNEENERVVGSRQCSDSATATMEHNGIETIYKEEGIVEKNITVQNLEDNFVVEKGPEEYYSNLVSISEVNGKDLPGLQSSLSDHHHIVNEEIQRKVNGVAGIVELDKETVKEILEEDKANNAEGLGLHFEPHVVAKEGGDLSNLPKAIPSTPLQSLEDIDREVYRTRDKQETIKNSPGDQSQQILLEEYTVLKPENGEILRKGMQLVGDSSNVIIISTDGINHEKVDTNTGSSDFTFQANQKEVTESTVAAAFTAQSNQFKVTASVDTATEEQHPLQTSTPGREASEVTPLLQGVHSIGFLNSIEQHSQVHMEIPTTDIAVMQFKGEAEEESERSPLLSPRESSVGDFRIPNHSARFKKPLQSLLTEGEVGMWSPLKEPESNSKSSIMVSSPRSKKKQKPRSSLFTSCMCCTTATN